MKSHLKKACWTAAALSAAALLLPTAGVAAADAPVSGTAATLYVGAFSPALVVSPDGAKAYAVVTDGGDIVRVRAVDTQSDTITGQVTLGARQTAGQVTVGHAVQTGTYAALSTDGSRLYALNGQSLSVVDTASLTVLATVAMPEQSVWTGANAGRTTGLTVTPDGATVLVSQNGPTSDAGSQWGAHSGLGRVVAFSTAKRAFTFDCVVPALTLGAPVAEPGDQEHDAYLGTNAGVFHVVETRGVPQVASLVQGTEKAYAYNLAFTPDGSRLFAVNGTGTGQSALIDPASDTLTGNLTLTTGGAELRYPQVSADGARLYVAQDAPTKVWPLPHPSVLAFDAVTGAAVPAETVSAQDEQQITGLSAGRDGHTLYIAGTDWIGATLQIVTH